MPTALGTIEVIRGWNSIDIKAIKKKEKKFRFVNTHLEAFSAFVRRGQASELMSTSGAVDTGKPVILLGDLNSDPADPTTQTLPPFPETANDAAYNLIVGNESPTDGGFADRGVAVNTCCWGELITDPPPSAFSSRIDHVLSRGSISEVSSALIGNDPALRTNTDLWPSDHGGVVAKLKVR